MTGTLLRKILGHPEKPREQLPGQPVRPLARIPQAGTGRPEEKGRGNLGQAQLTTSQVLWVPRSRLRGFEESSHGTLRLVTGEVAAGWGQAPVTGGQAAR